MGRPLVSEILGQIDPVEAKRLFSIGIRSASAVTPSEKVQVTLI